MVRHLVIVLLFSWSFGSNAQSFPLPETHPKTLVVKKVYRNILSVANNQQLGNLPSIQIIPRKKNTAAYAPNSNTIKIEETAYDVCANLGNNRDAALAILIAHEFTHFSKKHAGVRGFSCAYYDNTNELTHSNQEEEADFWGLFTAYLAGYNVLEVAPTLLTSIYKHYGFAQNMQGYPPLQIRQQLGKVAIQKLEEYIQLYEAGNYLTAIGAYEQAASCYATILKEYQSPELYNNLSVSLIRQALVVSPKEDFPFVYPVALEVESRLYRHRKPPFGFDPRRLGTSYLQKAIVQLEKALQLKGNHTAARLNLAIAQEMLGQTNLAKNSLNTIPPTTLNPTQQAHWNILQGIIAAKNNQLTSSRQYFQQAAHTTVGQSNLNLLNGISNTAAPIGNAIASTVSLDNIIDLRRVQQYKTKIPLSSKMNSDYYQPNYQFQYQLLPNSSLWKISRSRKLEQYMLQVTTSSIAFTEEGLHVGSSLDAIQNAFGSNGITTNTTKGQFLYYPTKGLIFLLNERGLIQQWGKVCLVGNNF